MLYAKVKKLINLLLFYSNKNKNQHFKINNHYEPRFLLIILNLHFWNILLVIIILFIKVLAVEFGGYIISFIIFLSIFFHLLIIQLVNRFLKQLIKKIQ